MKYINEKGAGGGLEPGQKREDDCVLFPHFRMCLNPTLFFLSLSLTHSLSLSHTHTHTHTPTQPQHTHTHTHTHTQFNHSHIYIIMLITTQEYIVKQILLF